jgi:hypothetical protein
MDLGIETNSDFSPHLPVHSYSTSQVIKLAFSISLAREGYYKIGNYSTRLASKELLAVSLRLTFLELCCCCY